MWYLLVLLASYGSVGDAMTQKQDTWPTLLSWKKKLCNRNSIEGKVVIYY